MTGEPPQLPVRAPWLRSARRLAIVLGVVATCVALLWCAGVANVVYDGYRAPREEREMEAFASDLSRDLLDGEADVVYAGLSADARHWYSAQDLGRRAV